MKLTLAFVALAFFVGAATAATGVPDVNDVAPEVPSLANVNDLDAGLGSPHSLLNRRSAHVHARAALADGQSTLKDLEGQLSGLGSVSKRSSSAVAEAQSAVQDAIAEYGSAMENIKRATGSGFEGAVTSAAKRAQAALASARKAIQAAISDPSSATKKKGDQSPTKILSQAQEALKEAEKAFRAAFGSLDKRDGGLLGDANVLGLQNKGNSAAGPPLPFPFGKRDGLLLNNIGVLADQENKAEDNPTDLTGVNVPAIEDLMPRDGLLVNNVAVLSGQKNTKGNSEKMALADLEDVQKLMARDGVIGNNVNVGGKQANSRKGSKSKGTLIKSPDLEGLLPRAGVVFNNLNLLGDQTKHRQTSGADQKLIGRGLTGAVEVADVNLIGSDGSLLEQDSESPLSNLQQ